MALLGAPPALPHARPDGDDGELRGQEHDAGHDDARQVDAHALRAVLGHEDGAAARVGRVAHHLAGVEAELVHDADALHEQQVLPRTGVRHGGGRGGAPPSSLAERLDGPQLARGVFGVALYRLAGGQARRDQRTELHHFGRGELEGVEV